MPNHKPSLFVIAFLAVIGAGAGGIAGFLLPIPITALLSVTGIEAAMWVFLGACGGALLGLFAGILVGLGR